MNENLWKALFAYKQGQLEEDRLSRIIAANQMTALRTGLVEDAQKIEALKFLLSKRTRR